MFIILHDKYKNEYIININQIQMIEKDDEGSSIHFTDNTRMLAIESQDKIRHVLYNNNLITRVPM